MYHAPAGMLTRFFRRSTRGSVSAFLLHRLRRPGPPRGVARPRPPHSLQRSSESARGVRAMTEPQQSTPADSFGIIGSRSVRSKFSGSGVDQSACREVTHYRHFRTLRPARLLPRCSVGSGWPADCAAKLPTGSACILNAFQSRRTTWWVARDSPPLHGISRHRSRKAQPPRVAYSNAVVWLRSISTSGQPFIWQ